MQHRSEEAKELSLEHLGRISCLNTSQFHSKKALSNHNHASLRGLLPLPMHFDRKALGWYTPLGHSHWWAWVRAISPERWTRFLSSKFYAHAHMPLMGSSQAQIGHNAINTMDTAPSTRLMLKAIAPQSKVTETKFYANAHIPLMGGLNTQFW